MIIAAGKFQGARATQTPIGCLITNVRRSKTEGVQSSREYDLLHLRTTRQSQVHSQPLLGLLALVYRLDNELGNIVFVFSYQPVPTKQQLRSLARIHLLVLDEGFVR